MEREYQAVEQASCAPLRSMPMIRKGRHLRRPVFIAYDDIYAQAQAYELNGMDSYMSRKDERKNKYGDNDMSVDDILSEFHSGALFSDFGRGGDDDVRLYEPSRRRNEYAPEIDSRFNTGGRKKSDRPVPSWDMDISSDDDYVPTEQSRRAVPAEEYDEEQDALPRSGKPKFSFGKNKKKDKKSRTSYQPKYIVEEEHEEADEDDLFARGFRDISAEQSAYAGIDIDTDSADERGEDEDYPDDEHAESYAPPSFSEYVASVFATIFFRLRGTHRGESSATMNDEDEDLGAEVSCKDAAKYYGSYVHATRMRLRIACGLLAFMAYISLGLPIPGMLAYLPVTAAMCMAIQFTIMLLALDIVTTGILKMAHLQMGADSLAVVACLITSADAAMVALGSSVSSHIPLCAVSSLSLVGVMLSSLLSVRALRKTLRVPAIAKRIYSVVGDNDIKGKGITLVKTSRPATGFVRRCEEAAPDETLFAKLTPFMLLAAMLLALIVSAVTHNYYDILYIFSAVLAPAVPVTALICFALPFFLGSMQIFSSGAAIAGWSGLCDIGQSSNLIVTDRDLFPESSISVESIRIFADEDAQKVISYAGTLIIASGCSMSKAFSDEMEQNGCTVQPMSNFECLSGGGMKGIIDGHVVLCGSSDLMRLMNVRIPFRLVDKTTVLLAIDGILYGIFSMNYQPLPQVRRALVELMRSNRHPIFALRDFNITPEMLKTTFDIATDGYDFPPYVERFKITETKPSENSKIAAVVCREGLASVTSMADTGKNIYTATRVNLIISVLSAILGMLVVFVKMLSTGSIGLGFILLYMLLTAIPVVIVSVFMKF